MRITDKFMDSIMTNGDYSVNQQKNVEKIPSMTVMVINSMNDISSVADTLLKQDRVIMNLESVDSELKQRCLNFMTGVCYYTDGSIIEVSENIFLIQK